MTAESLVNEAANGGYHATVPEAIRVTAAVIRRNGNILLARRLPG